MKSFVQSSFKRITTASLLGLLFSALSMAPAMAESKAADNQLLQSIVHGLDYVAVDYPAVIKDGKVLNADEYAEQGEIAQHTLSQMQTLADNPQKAQLIQQAQALQQAIQNKATGAEVNALCRDLIALLVASYHVTIAPKVTPSITVGQQLFQENCVACHGLTGMGDGVRAAELTPKPVNFHDHERQQHRNIYSLYNTISLGVNDTAMPAFTQFSAAQRWALAFYVSQFYATAEERQRGGQLWSEQKFQQAFGNMQQLTQAKPAEVQAQWGEDGLAVLAYLRANPQAVQSSQQTPLDVSREFLGASLSAYQQGKGKEAYEKSLAAYFEGFELVEAKLKTIAAKLRTDIEQQMVKYRSLIKDKADIEQVEQQQQTVLQLLDKADEVLQTSTAASSSVNFVTSLVILLREGLEAILVLAAIVSVLVKAGRRDALRYIHTGWMGALALGFLTWYLASNFITFSGANRELTEGITALVAAGMLFYVGFWLHNQSNAMQWQKFVNSKINSSLSTGALWGLAFMAFLAVYREVFESVLFYQSLMLNSGPDQQGSIIAGIVVAATVLVILAWLIMRYSVRLPLRAFFRVNMLLMFLLAVVFAGKGVAAMQEAGIFPMNPVNFPEIDLLGVYPNMESLGLQLGLIVLALSWGAYGYLKNERGHMVAK
jgi:high-affinity iron transporter